MQTRPRLRRIVTENVFWFMGSLALAILVWMIATAQLNPVQEWRLLEPIPIRVAPDPGLVIINEEDFTRTARVQLRAQQSVRELLVADDIIIWADLSGLGPGEHTVELKSESARAANIVDVSPRQITVQLEEVASKLVEVRAAFTNDPPQGFVVVGEPTFDVNQVTVTGPASQVEQVAAAQVPVDLSGQRALFEDFARPIPVDADGNPVPDVTVDTQVVGVQVEIAPVSAE